MSKTVTANAAEATSHYDIVISGGGVVGCLMAIALATHTSHKVLLLEAHEQALAEPKQAGDELPSNTAKQAARFDARVIALASESLQILAQLGLDMQKIAHQPISQIHVSDKGHIGQVRLNAKDYGLDALGKVVAVDALGDYLLKAVQVKSASITYRAPLSIKYVEQSPSYATIDLSDNTRVSTRLLIVSDGGGSKTAELAGMKRCTKPYSQCAVIANVSTQRAHNNIAYERFTSQGPIAFLPMNTGAVNQPNARNLSQHSMSVVWCMERQNAERIMALSDDEFLRVLTQLFGSKLGKLATASTRFSYPLSLMQSEPFVLNRAVAIGNAAQTLHPIAGQGFNLGIRDVNDLVRAIKDSPDPGAYECLARYQKTRKRDKQATISATEALVSIFSNQYFPLVVGRNIALLAMNKTVPLKQYFAHFAMGARKKHD